jgi:hypothetical protein
VKHLLEHLSCVEYKDKQMYKFSMSNFNDDTKCYEIDEYLFDPANDYLIMLDTYS